MEKTINTFEVKYLQILDESGNCDEELMPKLTSAQIKKLYELMVLTRIFDEKALNLQRQGRLGTYAQIKGQEACQIGSAILMEKEDLAFPAFREHGLYLTRGMPPEMLLQYWGGDERGMKIPKNVNVFSVSIPVGSHALHATGAAMGFAYQKKKSVALAYFGDGATSEGDFHEALNFASVFKAPAIFICQNNQYAISTPVKEQSASETLAQKAIAHGMQGIKVDGNDVFAVYKATQDAMTKAREGKGPTFIECLTYRIGDHTTADDAKRYRNDSEVKQWEKKDPILRLKNYLIKKKLFSSAYEKEVAKNSEKLIDEAIKKYESQEAEDPEEIFHYTFAELTPNLKEQIDKMNEQIKIKKEVEK